MKKITLLLTIFLCSVQLSLPSTNVEFDKVLKDFEVYAKNAMEEVKTPGMSIAIVKDGKVVFTKGFGVKEVGSNDPVDAHTLFQIGSISKSFTSALVAKAVTEKTLSWKDKVINHWPDFAMHDPWVTKEFQIDDTLAQRSGLPSYAGDAQLYFDYSNDKILSSLRYIEPVTSFRTTFAYQNVFFNVASKVLQMHSGITLSLMLQKDIFKVLGMNESSATYESYTNSANVTAGHYEDSRQNTLKLTKVEDIKPLYTYAPAGGINSNCIDMSKWLLFQLNKGKVGDAEIISPENMQKMHTAHVYIGDFNGAQSYYCLGWILSLFDPHPIIWHNGGTNGYSSMCAFSPNENIGIVILTNKRGPELHHALALQFFDMYHGKNDVDWNKKLMSLALEKNQKKMITAPTNPTPPLPYDHYVGDYTNDIFGSIRVYTEKNALKVSLNDDKLHMTLNPFDHDAFNIAWDFDEEGIENKAVFTFDYEGQPQTLYLEVLGSDNQGLFKFVPKVKEK